jgi:hypothetical protein
VVIEVRFCFCFAFFSYVFLSFSHSSLLDEHVSIDQNLQFTPNGLTIAFWFKADGTATWSRLFEFGNGKNTNNIIVTINEGWLRAIIYYNDGTMFDNSNIHAYQVNDNVWRHFTWVIHPSGGFDFFVDGPGGWVHKDGRYPDLTDRNNNYLGRSSWGPTWTFFYSKVPTDGEELAEHVGEFIADSLLDAFGLSDEPPDASLYRTVIFDSIPSYIDDPSVFDDLKFVWRNPGDPSLNGVIDDFRIYNTDLIASAVFVLSDPSRKPTYDGPFIRPQG